MENVSEMIGRIYAIMNGYSLSCLLGAGTRGKNHAYEPQLLVPYVVHHLL